MQNIKFRAWAQGVNEMTFFDRVIVATGELSEGKAWGMFFPSATGKVFLGGYSDPMQFTGLFDRGGKEIYEGDVIRITTKRRLHDGYEFVTFNAVIEWQDGAFWFRGINHNQTDCNWHFYNACDREIVGNIHENPELLTQ